MSNEQSPKKPELKPKTIKLRAPIPSGSDIFNAPKRHDGGWLVNDPDGNVNYWVPDANVVMVELG